MPQFYFHIRHDKAVFEDRRGRDFPDLKAAWDWAAIDVRTIIREEQINGSPDQCWVEICDLTGNTIASLPFVRVLN